MINIYSISALYSEYEYINISYYYNKSKNKKIQTYTFLHLVILISKTDNVVSPGRSANGLDSQVRITPESHSSKLNMNSINKTYIKIRVDSIMQSGPNVVL